MSGGDREPASVFDEIRAICALHVPPRPMSADDTRTYWDQCHEFIALAEMVRSAHISVFGSVLSRALTSVERTAVLAAVDDRRRSRWSTPSESHNLCWICGRPYLWRKDVPYAPATDAILRDPPIDWLLLSCTHQIARTCGEDVCVHRAREHGPVGSPRWTGRQTLAEARRERRRSRARRST